MMLLLTKNNLKEDTEWQKAKAQNYRGRKKDVEINILSRPTASQTEREREREGNLL